MRLAFQDIEKILAIDMTELLERPYGAISIINGFVRIPAVIVLIAKYIVDAGRQRRVHVVEGVLRLLQCRKVVEAGGSVLVGLKPHFDDHGVTGDIVIRIALRPAGELLRVTLQRLERLTRLDDLARLQQNDDRAKRKARKPLDDAGRKSMDRGAQRRHPAIQHKTPTAFGFYDSRHMRRIAAQGRVAHSLRQQIVLSEPR
ncbi:MAG: hypothetical protein MI723_04085, partial [Caulobacterales bacterium]|nr:hypothetical protein [Caulobacterales bacterium]